MNGNICDEAPQLRGASSFKNLFYVYAFIRIHELTADPLYNEQQLIHRIAGGDQAAMEEVFAAFYFRLLYFARKIIQNDTEAEDIAQEALLNFWENVYQKGIIPRRIAPYLFQMVKNRCYTYASRQIMKAGKEEQLAQAQSLEQHMEEQILQEDLFNKIYQAFAQLSSQQATIMKMIFIEGLDTAEIAQRLNITPNFVRNEKARAIQKLRLVLGRFVNFILFFS